MIARMTTGKRIRLANPLWAIGALIFSMFLSACAGTGSDGLLAGLDGPAEQQAGGPDLAQAGPLGEKALGRVDAPVTVIEYASLGCPICRVFHQKVFPRLQKAYIDTGKVRFVYREFPIGNSSTAAAVAARCVADKHYFAVNEEFLANQGRWNAREPNHDALYKFVQDKGLPRAEFDSCMANQKTNDGIVWVKQRGRELGVKGTPTFFVNGEKVRGVLSFEEMQTLIEKHLQGAAKPA